MSGRTRLDGEVERLGRVVAARQAKLDRLEQDTERERQRRQRAVIDAKRKYDDAVARQQHAEQKREKRRALVKSVAR